MRRKILISILACLPFDGAAQPYSESMADCAAHFQNAAQWMSDPERADRLMFLAREWHAAALVQSTRAGRSTTADAMWVLIDSKSRALEAKGGTYFLTEAFRDWSAYCRKFGKHMGVAQQP